MRKPTRKYAIKESKNDKPDVIVNPVVTNDRKTRNLASLHGRRAPFPLSVKPMLAQAAERPFDSTDWVYEVKWDGVRSILYYRKDSHVIEFRSRNDKAITSRYPELVGAVSQNVGCKNSVVLDGEIVVLN